MRKLLALLALVCLTNVSTAAAQSCTSTDDSTLAQCVYDSVETCRVANQSCNGYKASLTIEDVRTIAINQCCGKRTRVARTACLNKEKRKYVPDVGGGQQRVFFKGARSAINDVRKNVCRNSTYEIQEDSSLF